jgi:hypothetical protein
LYEIQANSYKNARQSGAGAGMAVSIIFSINRLFIGFCNVNYPYFKGLPYTRLLLPNLPPVAIAKLHHGLWSDHNKLACGWARTNYEPAGFLTPPPAPSARVP